MKFTLHKVSDGIEILFNKKRIARFSAGYGWQILRDIVLRPGKEELISFHQLAPTCFGRVDKAPAITCDGSNVNIILKADAFKGALLQETTANLTYNGTSKSFVWEFSHKTEVRKPISNCCHFFGRTDVDPQYSETGVWHFEVTDPMPHRTFSPKDGPIPVDRPDILFPQAWFRKGGWKKNWTHFLFTRNDGRKIRIPMNHLDNHDKDFWRQSPDGFIAFLGGKGTNLRYRFLDGSGRNICHHYCMWGYDIHFFEIVAPGSGTGSNPPPTLKPGKVFRHHSVLESITDAESEKLLCSSEEHPWRERDQARLENAPVYKPGINILQERLGRQDDRGFFQANSECKFLPHQPGRKTPGVLLIDNSYKPLSQAGKTMINAWGLSLGSDNWHTPIESGRIYEISAWVKLEASDLDTFAVIAAQYISQYNQAKPSWRVERSRVFLSNKISGKTGWQKLVLKTPKLPNTYICSMSISLELHGRGTCYFDEFEFRLL